MRFARIKAIVEIPKLTRYIGVDYSGARTPTASLKGLRVYLAEGDVPPAEVLPPRSPEPVMIATQLAGRERDRPSKARTTSMTPAAATAWAFRSGQRTLQVDPATAA